jgi:hypothetical protein
MSRSESNPPSRARLKEVLHLRKVVGAGDSRLSARPTALDRLLQFFLVWLLIYMVVQGQNGALAQTVDAVDARWVRLTFLNIPLQMLLTLLTAVGASSRSAPTRGLGWAAALLNLVLVVGHVVLSAMTA